ncbi:SusC/RagA family TonB-linked outer membrane protein [Hanamia caeni]|nr:TonB-dependent receptor [Hanamia caeni]
MRILIPAWLILSAALMLPQVTMAQQRTVSGEVLSAKDQSPLAGVSVMVKGTTNGTTTDPNGHFVLHDVTSKSMLEISFVGYVTKTIPAGNGTLRIELEQNAEHLEDVVVVGYGTQKKVNLTGAISTVDMTEKAGQPITNASNALHGVPGLYVNLSQSQPGVDRANILIRGMGTLNNNDPLVLVDGIEYSMDELNPNDIATITVLKDASAAIYGSRAANGVILITTKKGKGKSAVNYSDYFGVQKATYLPDAIWDPIVYMNLMNQAASNEGKKPYFDSADIEEYKAGMKTDPFTYPANNWFDIALRNGSIQKHDISVSGSTDKYSYRLSLGYLDRDGIIFGPNNSERKYSIGLNTSIHVSDKLEVGFTLDGYYRYYTQPSYSNSSFWQYLMRATPVENDTLANGNYGYTWLRVPGRNNWEQPRMIAYEGYDRKYVQRFVSTLFATYKLPFDISYHIKFGVDKYDGFRKSFIPQMVKEQAKTGTMYNWNSPSTAPRAYNYDDNDLNLHFYNTLNWQHKFASVHNVSVMVGASYDTYDNNSFMAETTGYLDASLEALSAGSVFQSISGNGTKDALESYFGRVNYDYKGKYLLEGIFRYDGSARFGPGHRWGSFPGLSAGWRIDKEDFFKSNFINLLKIRASYGKLGNQAVPLYSYQSFITLGHDYSFGGPNGVLSPGAAATAYSEPKLSWETTTDYDLGVDINFLQNKINLSADIYRKQTTGILRPVNLPAQVGNLTGPQENVGSVNNDGIEVVAQYRDNIGEFNYSVYGNVAYNKNKVTDLDGQILYDYQTNLSTITKEGLPIDAFYLYQAEGIFQSKDEVENSAYQSPDTKQGWIKYKDINDDGKIDGDDRVAMDISSAFPKYTFGFGVKLGYKGISLDAFFQGVAGIKIFPTANYAFPLNNGAGATWEWVTDSWTPERPNAKLPAIIESNYGSKGNYLPSTFWLKDGDYVRLKNIQLSYELPAKWLDKVKISRFSVFLNAENWLTFAKYKEFDPESTVNVSSLYHYPMLKTFTGGINVTF